MMKHLKPFDQGLREGDWWDNDPSAPWNAPEDPEPEAEVDYTEAQQDFTFLIHCPDTALLKLKRDGSLWTLNTVDLEDEEDFKSYIYYIDVDGDKERFEDMMEYSYVNYATDVLKEKKGYDGDDALGEWNRFEDDGEGYRLIKIDLPLAEHLIEDFYRYSKSVHFAKYRGSYRTGASILSRAFPEANEA